MTANLQACGTLFACLLLIGHPATGMKTHHSCVAYTNLVAHINSQHGLKTEVYPPYMAHNINNASLTTSLLRRLKPVQAQREGVKTGCHCCSCCSLVRHRNSGVPSVDQAPKYHGVYHASWAVHRCGKVRTGLAHKTDIRFYTPLPRG